MRSRHGAQRGLPDGSHRCRSRRAVLRCLSGAPGGARNFEQHVVPGGYATSFNRLAGRFTFEVSLHGTTAKNNAVERILKNLGVHDQIEFVPLPETYCLKTPGRGHPCSTVRPEKYISSLAALYPDEEIGIRAFVNEIIGITDESDLIHQRGGKFLRLIFPLQYRKMWNVRNKTLQDLLDDYVRNPALKDAPLCSLGLLRPAPVSALRILLCRRHRGIHQERLVLHQATVPEFKQRAGRGHR